MSQELFPIYVRERCNPLQFCIDIIAPQYKDSTKTIHEDYKRKAGEQIYLPFLIYIQKQKPRYLLLPLFPLQNEIYFSEEIVKLIETFMLKLNGSSEIYCKLPTNVIDQNFQLRHPNFKVYIQTEGEDFNEVYFSVGNKTSYLSYFFHSSGQVEPVLLITDDKKNKMFIPWQILKQFYQPRPRDEINEYLDKYGIRLSDLAFQFILENGNNSLNSVQDYNLSNEKLIFHFIEYLEFLESGGYWE